MYDDDFDDVQSARGDSRRAAFVRAGRRLVQQSAEVSGTNMDPNAPILQRAEREEGAPPPKPDLRSREGRLRALAQGWRASGLRGPASRDGDQGTQRVTPNRRIFSEQLEAGEIVDTSAPPPEEPRQQTQAEAREDKIAKRLNTIEDALAELLKVQTNRLKTEQEGQPAAEAKQEGDDETPEW